MVLEAIKGIVHLHIKVGYDDDLLSRPQKHRFTYSSISET